MDIPSRFVLVLTLAVALSLSGRADAANYFDDACPDQGGKAFIVDSPGKAATLANGYNLPTCDVILRIGLDPATITEPTLRIRARSLTLQGPLEIGNPHKDSILVLSADSGNLVIADARLAAAETVQLECRAMPGCLVKVQKGSRIQARRIRTFAGGITIEDTTLVGGDMDVRTGSLR